MSFVYRLDYFILATNQKSTFFYHDYKLLCTISTWCTDVHQWCFTLIYYWIFLFLCEKHFTMLCYVISKTSKTVLTLMFITFEIWNIATFTRTETYLIKTKHYSNGKQRHAHRLRKFVDQIALRMWNVEFLAKQICTKFL
jgi:hypothetical protein